MGRRQHRSGTATGTDGALWTHTDALVAVAAGVLDAVGNLLFGALDGERGPGLPGFLLALLAALPLLARRSRPVPALAAVLVLSAAADLFGPGTPHFGVVLTVALYSVARVGGPATAAAAALATAVTTVLGQSHFRTPAWDVAVSAPCSALLVAAAALAVARWQREVTANRQLLADRAVAEERRRIARELHDIVAHHITTMQLMAGGARANLADPEVVRDALVTLESSGRLALREMRQLLDVLRAGDEPDAVPPAPQPGTDDLPRLLEESRRAGLPADLTVRGEPRPLPPALGLTVFRIVQEALTNTRKHGGPTRAAVRLTYHPDVLTVHVRDHGSGPATAHPPTERGGHGLIGMHERAALHGGTLTATPHPDGGFVVHAELPLPADESVGPPDELPRTAAEFTSRPAELPTLAAESAVLPAEARR
ncbi:sensor histidine kinase [Kitasatospora phosalacinea]|uniref:sensor histidine kinase n=1 Tax=Kitasatospora phosalacinea TaxID=2065 RepID=UPI0009DDE316|nr:sensor histidine kinase [Kitasatospora phosalacinea]